MSNINREMKRKLFNLHLKMLLAFLALFSLMALVSWLVYQNGAVQYANLRVRREMVQTVEGIAAGVDIDMLMALTRTGEPNAEGVSDDPRYLALMDWLGTAHLIEPDAWPYLYIPGDKPNEIYYVVDLGVRYSQIPSNGFLESYISDSEFILLGLEEMTFREVDHPLVRVLRGLAEDEKWGWLAGFLRSVADWLEDSEIAPPRSFGYSSDKTGDWPSIYMPLADGNDSKVAAIGVDFRANYFDSVRRDAQRRAVVVLFAVMPIGIIFLLIFYNRFVHPVQKLIFITQQVSTDGQPVSYRGYRRVWLRDELDMLAEVLQEMVEAIGQRERRYHAVISTQDAVILRTDPQGRVTFKNKAYDDLRGQQVIKSLWDLPAEGIHPDDFEIAGAQLRQYMSEISPDDPERGLEIRIYDQDERLRWFTWTITGIYDGRGELFEFQVVGQDITDLKEASLNLEEANIRLQELSHELIEAQDRERITLAREIHDDLLNYLSGLLLEMEGDVPAERVRETYEQIAARLRTTIYNLRPPMLTYGLKFGIEDYLDSLRERVQGEIGVVLAVAGDGTSYPQEVNTHLFRIVQQACENAVEHSGASRLEITGEISADQIQLTIEDDGSGFPWEGDQFVSASVSQRHFGLTGMLERGRIIGADVQIKSAPGEGTRVRIAYRPEERKGNRF